MVLKLFVLSRSSKNPKFGLCDFNLWPTTLKFDNILETVKMLVRAKFNEIKCRGTWIIVVPGNSETEKKLRNNAKNNTVVSTQTVIMALQLSTVTKQHWNEHFTYTVCQFFCAIMHHIIYQCAIFSAALLCFGSVKCYIPFTQWRKHQKTSSKQQANTEQI